MSLPQSFMEWGSIGAGIVVPLELESTEEAGRPESRPVMVAEHVFRYLKRTMTERLSSCPVFSRGQRRGKKNIPSD